MIITRTPLRLSFVGGGTDLPDFYTKYGGAVVSMTLNRYMYVSVNPSFNRRIRLSYSRTENVDEPGELKHELARAILKHWGLHGLEITSVADIPGSGTGLGSSSAFTVGLLLALTAMSKGKWCPASLAEGAFYVENSLCGHTLGKQDQYACAYGSLHFYEFRQDGTVGVEPFNLLDEEKCYIANRLMLFWTGKTRKASPILATQNANLAYSESAIHVGKQMRITALTLRGELDKGNLDYIGPAMDWNWGLKKQLSGKISNRVIDATYDRAMQAGALGGKLCGAGGGGFLLFYAQPEKQDAIEKAVQLPRLFVKFEERGSKVIYDGGEYEKDNHC